MKEQKTRVLFDPVQIDDCVWGIAKHINEKYKNGDEEVNIVFCPILTGVIPFFTNLTTYLEFDPYIEYIGAASYEGTEQQEVKTYRMPDPELIKGKDVWLFDDIADSGKTLQYLTDILTSYGAKRVYTCVLLKKNTCPFPVDIYGFPLEDDAWIHGYGLDAPNGRGRISPALYATTL
tara:strand:+ start:4107 stop:4637 length:531 start_codon:yes stop_codon:yes gene_type:complete